MKNVKRETLLMQEYKNVLGKIYDEHERKSQDIYLEIKDNDLSPNQKILMDAHDEVCHKLGKRSLLLEDYPSSLSIYQIESEIQLLKNSKNMHALSLLPILDKGFIEFGQIKGKNYYDLFAGANNEKISTTASISELDLNKLEAKVSSVYLKVDGVSGYNNQNSKEVIEKNQIEPTKLKSNLVASALKELSEKEVRVNKKGFVMKR